MTHPSSHAGMQGFPDLFGGNTALLGAALTGLSKRHEAIVSNVANATTPGYKRRVVPFEQQLSALLNQSNDDENPEGENMSRTQNAHIDAQQVEAVEQNFSVERSSFQYRQDQNGVDVEGEMAELAKNSQKYIAVSRLMFKKFDGLRNIIKSSSS